MVRCGCATDRCNCVIIGGDGVEIAGSGSASNPYVVSAVIPTSGGGDGSGRFSGEIVAYGGPVAPVGWHLCDGGELSRTVDAALFAVIGIAYGAGDGTTTFNLPDLTGSFPIGVDGTYPRGASGGSDTLEEANLPQHDHSIDHDHPAANTTANGVHDHQTWHNNSDGASASTFRTADPTGREQDTSLVQNSSSHSHSVNVPAFSGTSGPGGSADPDPFLPPYQAVNYIMKG